ncbi:MAG TPA: hypothetical protein VMZ52_20390, partial [Bryobacteraceae bacterium]|nr:hypothetical protein [Bryobacteraceae bacterium]
MRDDGISEMADTAAFPWSTTGDTPGSVAEPAAIPWFVWTLVLAATSAIVGMHWDISWHRTIGRDTFLTPAHLAIYLCGVLAGISSSFLILHTTFSPGSRLRETSVCVLGLRGPLGAFIAAWGGIAMLVSAPFDDWWHNAYGLDVKVLSPPHVLLGVGMVAIQHGALILILGRMNRAGGAERRALTWLFLYVTGVILNVMMIFIVEYAIQPFMHSAIFYRAVMLAAPAILLAAAIGSGHRWGATITACVYMAIQLVMLWILPLFPGQPKLGPVFHNVTHFIPMDFPLLLVAPAVLLDLLLRAPGHVKRAWLAPVAAVIILLSTAAVQWRFSTFLLSPAARNRFFGGDYLDFMTNPASRFGRHLFISYEKSVSDFWIGMAIALAAGIVTSYIGISRGRWMRHVRR